MPTTAFPSKAPVLKVTFAKRKRAISPDLWEEVDLPVISSLPICCIIKTCAKHAEEEKKQAVEKKDKEAEEDKEVAEILVSAM